MPRHVFSSRYFLILKFFFYWNIRSPLLSRRKPLGKTLPKPILSPFASSSGREGEYQLIQDGAPSATENPHSHPPRRPDLRWGIAGVDMPGRLSDPGDALVPFSSQVHDPVVYSVRHGLKPPIFRVYVAWSRGNLLHVACLRERTPSESGEDDDSRHPEAQAGGVVVEVQLQGGANGEISEAQQRRIAYGSVPAFALLQSRRNALMSASRMQFSSFRTEW